MLTTIDFRRGDAAICPPAEIETRLDSILATGDLV
jgi:hypothetical protein